MGFFMLRFLSDYFYFNQRERRGIIGLFILIGLIALFNFLAGIIIPEDKEVYHKFYTQVALIDSITKQQDSIKKIAVPLFKFDPNQLDHNGWEQLGLSSKQAQTILNYRAKGGRFYKKEDLLKMYSISDSVYKKLEPYIQIKPHKKSITKSKVLKIELNSTDSSELIKVRGIGPVFAKRIIKYRELLGGYHSVSQLKEVYGINQEKFELIQANFIPCDSNLIRRININQASFKELLKHPYISFDFTKFIVNRRGKKAFIKLIQLKDDHLISDKNFKKLLPYLKLK